MTKLKVAPHKRSAFTAIVSNTGCTSVGELEMTRRTSEVAVCCSRASLSSRCACTSRHSRSVADSCAIAAVPSHLPSFDAAPRGTIEILRDARKRLNALRPRSTKGSPPVPSWPGKFDSPARRRGDRIGVRRKDFLKCKPSRTPGVHALATPHLRATGRERWSCPGKAAGSPPRSSPKCRAGCLRYARQDDPPSAQSAATNARILQQDLEYRIPRSPDP